MKFPRLFFCQFLVASVRADCSENTGYDDEASLTEKIAAWRSIVLHFIIVDFCSTKD